MDLLHLMVPCEQGGAAPRGAPPKNRHLRPYQWEARKAGRRRRRGGRQAVLTMGKPLKLGGTAWQYLVDNVGCGVGEGAKVPSYYAGQGTPPGKFVGQGLVGLGPHPGAVKAGDVVSPEMLYRMLVQLADPMTGEPLGRPVPIGGKAPMAGYDLTFNVPKSLSLIWALGDQATRAGIEEVLERSVAEVIGWAEEHQVFCTRTGAQGARQEPVVGVVASNWLH